MGPEISFVLALIPIVSLLVALGAFGAPAHWVTPLVLILTAALAFFFFSMPLENLFGALLEGSLFALWPIMIVIVAAIYTYKLAESTGALKTIQTMLSGITNDKRIQVLILAWGFGGFLESVAGYGTAVAIPASILAVLGFNPLFAAVISLIANTVPTAFGAVGIPVSTLASLVHLDPSTLSTAVALQLTPFIILVPFVLVMLTGGGFKAVKGVFWITLASGVSFAIPQLLAAAFLGPELPALLGSITSMLTTIFLAGLMKKTSQNPQETQIQGVQPKKRMMFKAWLPYILIFIFILLASKLVDPIHHFLGQFQSSFVLYPGGSPTSFKWIATPGVLIILAAIIGALIQGAKPLTLVKTFGTTLVTLRHSFLTVISILALAKIMDYSGMISSLAQVLVSITGPLYPLFSPFMGALGTFVTGSDTSSNILFGKLQTTVAQGTGISPYWLAAANTAGATAGKMISPQSIAVATAATKLTGKEGKILSQTLIFCLSYVLLLGLLVFLLAPLMVAQ